MGLLFNIIITIIIIVLIGILSRFFKKKEDNIKSPKQRDLNDKPLKEELIEKEDKKR